MARASYRYRNVIPIPPAPTTLIPLQEFFQPTNVAELPPVYLQHEIRSTEEITPQMAAETMETADHSNQELIQVVEEDIGSH
ncbi:hypothetical protein BGZ65_004496, partial [Modicella reniformis]